MSEPEPSAQTNSYGNAIGSFAMAWMVMALIAIPLTQWSVERGIGVSMILFPILWLFAWAAGGWLPFLQIIGVFILALILVAVRKVFPFPLVTQEEAETDVLLVPTIQISLD